MSHHKEPLLAADSTIEKIIEELYRLPNPNLASILEDHICALQTRNAELESAMREVQASFLKLIHGVV
jgi:hypothetical protein